jgi:hypothetical protein
MVDDDDESDGDENLLDGDPKANTNNLAERVVYAEQSNDHVIRIPSQEQTGWRFSGLKSVDHGVTVYVFSFVCLFLAYSYT